MLRAVTWMLNCSTAYQSALAISPLYFIHFILGVSRAPLWLRWIWFIAEYGAIFALSYVTNDITNAFP